MHLFSVLPVYTRPRLRVTCSRGFRFLRWQQVSCFSMAQVVAFVAMLVGHASVAHAQAGGVGARSRDSVTLTVAETRRLTLAHNPSLIAAREDVAIAGGGMRQSRLLRFNPDVSAVAPGAGIAGSRNASELTVMQEFEMAGQRGLRIDAAQFAVTRASSDVANTTRLMLANVSISFFRAFVAQQRLQVTQEVFQLTERLLDAVRTQLREGEISVLESNLAEIEFGRARARVLSAQRDASGTSLELARLVGVGPDTPLRLVHAAPTRADSSGAAARAFSVDSLTALALRSRPDLDAIDANVRESETLAALSRREAIPNLRLGVLAERNPGEHRTRLGPALGISLPLFNRSQGLVEQRRAEARQAQLQRDALRMQVRTEIETTVRALNSASAEVAVFEASVRQPSRANSALLETAFRAGKIALPTLLLLRNQLLDAELGYWQAWFAREEAQVLLDAASGALMPPATDMTSSRIDR